MYGLGGDSAVVSQNVLLQGWFDTTEIAFAMAINNNIGIIGSSINSYLTPLIVSIYDEIYIALLFSVILLGLGLMFSLVTFTLDY